MGKHQGQTLFIPTMLKTRRERCTKKQYSSPTNVFCSCGLPFIAKYRNVPCFHVFCQTCAQNHKSSNECKQCGVPLDSVEGLHPNEVLFPCTEKKCGSVFLNFASLKLHIYQKHPSDTELLEEISDLYGGSNAQGKVSCQP